MKRHELVRHLEVHGCSLLRDRGKYSIYVNPANNQGVAASEKVEETPPLFAFGKPGRHPADPVVSDDVGVFEMFRTPPKAKEFTLHLASGVTASLDRIDPMLARYAENWELGRMAAIDR